MDHSSLHTKISEYLATQKPKHSVSWHQEIERRVKELKSQFPEQHIRNIHAELLLELQKGAIINVRKNFPSYSVQDVEDIVQNALYSWFVNFDGEKGREGAYLYRCILTELSKKYNIENPILSKEDVIDEYGNEVLNKNKKKIKHSKRAKTIKTDFSDDLSNTKGRVDYGTYEYYDGKEGDVNTFLGNFETAQPKTLIKGDGDILSRSNRIFNAKTYDETRLNLEEKKSKSKPLSRFKESNSNRIKSVEILFRHYLLKNSAFSPGIHTPVNIENRFIPRIDFIQEVNKGATLDGINSATTNFKKRFSILKTAIEREFMELCVSELKDCVRLFDKEISEGYFTESDKNFIPLLSSVAVDKNNKLINFCHKGQKVSYNPQMERRSFQKHCEFTLLEEILKTEGTLSQLKGGTLFVTLEPCNKRKFYCISPKCNEMCSHDIVELKIPCAVRCLESGISKIYIGSYDTNPEVEKKGAEILESGCYSFLLRNGKLYSSEKSNNQNAKEIRAQELLENYFIKQGYKIEDENEHKRTYRISNGIEVNSFYPDLIEEICILNGQFLAFYNSKKFY